MLLFHTVFFFDSKIIQWGFSRELWPWTFCHSTILVWFWDSSFFSSFSIRWTINHAKKHTHTVFSSILPPHDVQAHASMGTWQANETDIYPFWLCIQIWYLFFFLLCFPSFCFLICSYPFFSRSIKPLFEYALIEIVQFYGIFHQIQLLYKYIFMNNKKICRW